MARRDDMTIVLDDYRGEMLTTSSTVRYQRFGDPDINSSIPPPKEEIQAQSLTDRPPLTRVKLVTDERIDDSPIPDTPALLVDPAK